MLHKYQLNFFRARKSLPNAKFCTRSIEIFPPDKLADDDQIGKFIASREVMQNWKLGRDQTGNSVQMETTLETRLHPCHAWFGKIRYSDDGSSITGA